MDENLIEFNQMTDWAVTASLLDAKQVKKLLNCSLPFVYKLADRGQIACVRWDCPGAGKERKKTVVRFKKKDVLDFIERNYMST
jgi:hypothetical protein